MILTPLNGCFAVLVLLLGSIIAAFSWRYLQGEAGRGRYLA